MDRAPGRRIGFTAPIGCIDMAAFDTQGESYEIRGCDYCLPWHAEVHVDDEGEIFVHHDGCG